MALFQRGVRHNRTPIMEEVMSPEMITIQTRTYSPDLKVFTGVIWFGLSAPWEEPDPKRRGRKFGFRADCRGAHGHIVFWEEGVAILDVGHIMIFDESRLWDFAAPKWEGFSATQREMIRLILMGVQQGILEHWGIFSDVTTRVIDGISREEILAVQFEPIIPL